MSDYELPDVFEENWQIAKKEHECCECRQTIAKGDKYQRVKGLWDGTWSTFKTCIFCDEQRHNYRTEVGETPPFTFLREWCLNSDITFWVDEIAAENAKRPTENTAAERGEGE